MYRIEEVAEDGEPIAPADVAKKIIKQCGVVVRYYIPITVREWNKPRRQEFVMSAPKAKITFGKSSWLISSYRRQRWIQMAIP